MSEYQPNKLLNLTDEEIDRLKAIDKALDSTCFGDPPDAALSIYISLKMNGWKLVKE